MKYNFTTKKLIIAAVTLSVIGGYTSSALNSQTIEATDEPPIVKEVERQGQVLENHEGRITNAESDIKAVQENTGTLPATERVVVREVQTPSTETQLVEAPSPVVVVSYEQVPVGNNLDCKLTYSDGTAYQWHWKTFGVDLDGNKTSITNNFCDSGWVGTVKT